MVERILEPEVMDTREDAVEYDAMDFTEVNTAFAERALELAPPNGLALDAGTGTARIPIVVLQRNRQLSIVAVDYSKHMLKVAEKNVKDAGYQEQIVLQFADAENLDYSASHFDFVMSNSLAHHLPDPLPFLKEILRVVKPNGGILIRDLLRPASKAALEALVEKYVGDCDEYQKKLYRDSLHASLTIAEVQELVNNAQLPDAKVVQSSDRHWSIERKWRPYD